MHKNHLVKMLFTTILSLNISYAGTVLSEEDLQSLKNILDKSINQNISPIKKIKTSFYLGYSSGSFSIIGSELSLKDPSIGFQSTSTTKTRDRGSLSTIQAGVLLNNTSRINFYAFSGKEEDSSIMSTSIIAISYDYNFNNHGVQKGWFVGIGASKVGVDMEETSSATASTEESIGALLRGGYSYKKGDHFLADFSINIHTADQEHSMKYISGGTVSNTATWSLSTSVNSYQFSLNYIF